MSQPFEAAGTFRGIISERESELETLKAQLANVEANLRTAEGNWELALDDRDQEIVRRRKSEAQVRELRAQLQLSQMRSQRLREAILGAVQDAMAKDEAALRSAPPGAHPSALTADVAQSTPDRSPSRGVTGKEHLVGNQEVAALGKQPSAVSAECDYRTRYGEKCTLSNGHEGGHGHIVRTAFPKATQTFLDKTNAGEERKDLARQGSDAATQKIVSETNTSAEAGSQKCSESLASGLASEQVPAAPRNKADSSVGDGVVTTEHLEDSQGAIPAEDTSPSRLRSKSGSAHCSSKAGLGGETAPTADGLSPQDSPSRSQLQVSFVDGPGMMFSALQSIAHTVEDYHKLKHRGEIGCCSELVCSVHTQAMFLVRAYPEYALPPHIEPAPPSPARDSTSDNNMQTDAKQDSTSRWQPMWRFKRVDQSSGEEDK